MTRQNLIGAMARAVWEADERGPWDELPQETREVLIECQAAALGEIEWRIPAFNELLRLLQID